MPKITITGADELQARLIRTANCWQKDVHVPFSRAALIIWASTKRRFASGGPGWPAPKMRKGQPLRHTGRLMASVTSKVGIYEESHGGKRHTLEVGTNVKYAGVHQFGYDGPQQVRAHKRTQTRAFGRMIAPRSVAVRAHTRQMKIPQREFLRFDDSDRQAIVQMFREWYFGNV